MNPTPSLVVHELLPHEIMGVIFEGHAILEYECLYERVTMCSFHFLPFLPTNCANFLHCERYAHLWMDFIQLDNCSRPFGADIYVFISHSKRHGNSRLRSSIHKQQLKSGNMKTTRYGKQVDRTNARVSFRWVPVSKKQKLKHDRGGSAMVRRSVRENVQSPVRTYTVPSIHIPYEQHLPHFFGPSCVPWPLSMIREPCPGSTTPNAR